MRHAFSLLAAAVLAAFVAQGAAAQEAWDAADELLVLRGPLVPEAATEEDETGRVERVLPVDSDPLDETTTGSLPRRTAAPETDPYAPLGIRSGGFILYPSLSVTAGTTTNATGTAGGAGSAYARVSPELEVRSDWAEHEATLALRGSYQVFFDGMTDDRPTAAIEATGRRDLGDGWSIAVEDGYGFETQAISDADFPAGVDSPPGVHDLRTSIALNHGGGRALVELESSLHRTIYEDGTSGGSVVDQGDRTNNVFGGRLRLGYEVGASVTPFVEAELRRRVYDRTVDNDGLMRSAFVQAYRAGLVFDRAPVLTGEAALGYARADFDDATLAALSNFTVDGSLAWSPREPVTVLLNGTTELRPSADPASSGAVAHQASVDVSYAWRRNVAIAATAGIRHERFQGTGQIDTLTSAGARLTWKANRWLWLTAGYEHERLDSTAAGRSYRSEAVMIELKALR
ncbi:MAG: outer membrane beta-barrel protein [Bauldia sp.]